MRLSSTGKPQGSMMSSGTAKQAESRMKAPRFCGMSGSYRARRMMPVLPLVRDAKAPGGLDAARCRRTPRTRPATNRALKHKALLRSIQGHLLGGRKEKAMAASSIPTGGHGDPTRRDFLMV